MDEKVACIYTLSDPRTRRVRYVGWTSREPQERLREHLSEARKLDRKYHRACWIRNLLKENKIPLLRVVAVVETTEAAALEVRYIAACRARGDGLVNGTSGGEGMLGWIPSTETRAKISAAKRGRVFGPQSPERREATSRALRGKKYGPLSAEHRAKLSRALRGKPHSKAHTDAIAASNRGKKRPPFTPEHRARLSLAGMGRSCPKSQEHRLKLSRANIGKIHSSETRAKMSAAQRARQMKG